MPIGGETLSLTIVASGASYTVSGTTDEEGVWQAIAVEDLTDLGATFITFFDVATLTIDYAGNAGDATMQPTAASNLVLEGIGLLRAEVTTEDTVLELNQDGVYELELTFQAELATQNTYIEGLTYEWVQQNESGNVTSSGLVEVKGGQLLLSGTANATDTLVLTSDPTKSWIQPSMNPISFTFIGGPEDQTNETDGNDTTNNTNTTGPSFPDATLPGTVDCGTATYPWIDDGTDASITCTVTNPNPFDVTLGFSWIEYPTTPPPLTFESVMGEPGPPTSISANGTTQIEFTPVRNGPSDGLFPGLQGDPYQIFFTCKSDGTNLCDSMTMPTASVEGELQWTLGEQPQVEEPVNQAPTENKGSATLIVGGIIGLLVLIGAGAGVVLLRNSEEEDDDWYMEEEEEPPVSKPVQKPTPSSSKTLDELKSEGRSLDDIEAPEERRPSLFDEFDGQDEGEIESHEIDQSEEEASDVEEEDDGISVDENGTEWWEDEEGVWWYREEGWEDWAVWEE